MIDSTRLASRTSSFEFRRVNECPGHRRAVLSAMLSIPTIPLRKFPVTDTRVRADINIYASSEINPLRRRNKAQFPYPLLPARKIFAATRSNKGKTNRAEIKQEEDRGATRRTQARGFESEEERKPLSLFLSLFLSVSGENTGEARIMKISAARRRRSAARRRRPLESFAITEPD